MYEDYSPIPEDATILPAKALLNIAELLQRGRMKHQDELGNKWKTSHHHVHLNHAMVHILRYLSGDRSEDHLLHAACRMLMCYECYAESPGNGTATDHIDSGS